METLTKTSKLESFFQEAEFNRFGLISTSLILVGCLGGIAVGLGAVESAFTLSLVVFPTMTALSMVLGVAPMRLLIWSAAIAVVIDLILITYYLFN